MLTRGQGSEAGGRVMAAGGIDIRSRSYSMSAGAVVQYSNMNRVPRFINGRLSLFESGRDSAQYLAITHINLGHFKELYRLREQGALGLPRFRCTYFGNEDTLIVELVGGPHEIMAGLFAEAFLEARLTQGIGRSRLIPYRAKQYRLTRGIRKEPDDSYMPTTRETDDYPSFIIKIGPSESLNKLRQDARLWLTRTND